MLGLDVTQLVPSEVTVTVSYWLVSMQFETPLMVPTSVTVLADASVLVTVIESPDRAVDVEITGSVTFMVPLVASAFIF